MKQNTIIIGAGLTGLTLAYLLRKTGQEVLLLEARDRIGGRIYTRSSAGDTPIEMGATWLGNQHRYLIALLEELEIDIFKQATDGIALFEPFSMAAPQAYTIPPNQDPSYRIKGGTETLIKKLSQHIDQPSIRLQETVFKITDKQSYLEVTTNNGTYQAAVIVSTLPPLLLAKTIEFEPALPLELSHLCGQTHIWMGDSIKFGLSFSRPFWKVQNYSGMVFSNVGPITEMYDHSNFEQNRFALMGFLNGGLASESRSYRQQKVLEQLRKFYGAAIDDFLSYEEVVWREESQTFAPADDFLLPHQNNGNEMFQKSYLGEKLYLAGSETGRPYGGYMDGAVQSAQYIFKELNRKS